MNDDNRRYCLHTEIISRSGPPPAPLKLVKKQVTISIRMKANGPLQDRNQNILAFDSRMTLTSK